MKAKDFPRTVGRLGRKDLRQQNGEVTSATYWLHGEGRLMEKFWPLRDVDFIVRAVRPGQYVVMVRNEPIGEASSQEGLRAALSSAFDHVCIRAGIEISSAKFKTAGQEENMVRRRRSPRSTAFDKFKTAGQEENMVRRRRAAPDTAFQKFKTAGQEENMVRRRRGSSTAAFKRFKSAE